ncbi:MAG: TetR/AcrR family transcriptional regulator [Spirochaetaceae bacterium]|nr:TetR/AcrR family transcriptional regulator [Spirochaetaceae bacterium]
MPRAFNEAERGKIRERLISAGKKAINRSGPRALVVDEVAREAGISKGSFYSFFPSREELILAVFESWEAEHRGALLAEMAEGSGTARERLARFFLGIFTILEREPGLAKLSFGEIERLVEGLPPERVAAHQAADKATMEGAFARWAEAGFMDPAFLASLEGLMPALFAMALHKEDFPPGSFEPAVRLIAEALALRLASGEEGGGT